MNKTKGGKKYEGSNADNRFFLASWSKDLTLGMIAMSVNHAVSAWFLIVCWLLIFFDYCCHCSLKKAAAICDDMKECTHFWMTVSWQRRTQQIPSKILRNNVELFSFFFGLTNGLLVFEEVSLRHIMYFWCMVNSINSPSFNLLNWFIGVAVYPLKTYDMLM